MYTHTKTEHAFTGSPPPTLGYFLCSTPRCGSSLIAEALCCSNLAGAPTEYFDQETMELFQKSWNVVSDDYMSTLLKRKTSPNGIFGAKTHYHQYQATFGQKLPTNFPVVKFIWISRRDKIRQSVSYWKAIETNQWATTHDSLNDSPQFNFAEIEKLRQQILFEQSQWQNFFDSHSIKPLRLTYEEFSESPLEAAQQCLEFLNVHQTVDWNSITLELKKQADELSEEWVNRIRKNSQ